MHTREKVSVTGKEADEYAPHSSTANHMQSAQTRTANKGKAGSEENWSKDSEEKNPSPEEDGAARPTTSLRKLRSQDQVKSVAGRHTICSWQ